MDRLSPKNRVDLLSKRVIILIKRARSVILFNTLRGL